MNEYYSSRIKKISKKCSNDNYEQFSELIPTSHYFAKGQKQTRSFFCFANVLNYNYLATLLTGGRHDHRGVPSVGRSDEPGLCSCDRQQPGAGHKHHLCQLSARRRKWIWRTPRHTGACVLPTIRRRYPRGRFRELDTQLIPGACYSNVALIDVESSTFLHDHNV